MKHLIHLLSMSKLAFPSCGNTSIFRVWYIWTATGVTHNYLSDSTDDSYWENAEPLYNNSVDQPDRYVSFLYTKPAIMGK